MLNASLNYSILGTYGGAEWDRNVNRALDVYIVPLCASQNMTMKVLFSFLQKTNGVPGFNALSILTTMHSLMPR